jgi:hypothetical protein
MSQILISISGGKLSFQLINVLAQIGITYFLCYLIMQLEFRWQAAIRGPDPFRQHIDTQPENPRLRDQDAHQVSPAPTFLPLPIQERPKL